MKSGPQQYGSFWVWLSQDIAQTILRFCPTRRKTHPVYWDRQRSGSYTRRAMHCQVHQRPIWNMRLGPVDHYTADGEEIK